MLACFGRIYRASQFMKEKKRGKEKRKRRVFGWWLVLYSVKSETVGLDCIANRG